jgi:RNA polymerase sigma factor (sigma-70 family)
MRAEEDARDVAQATIELGLRHLPSLRDTTKLRAWLFAIEAREASRWRRRLGSALSLERAPTEIIDAEADPRSIALRVAIAHLPRREREAVVLRYFGSLSVQLTARAMGVAENTVKTHLRLAMRALREALHE